MAARRGRKECRNINRLICPTREIAGIENLSEYSGLTNPKNPEIRKENAAAAGPRNGVEITEKKHPSAPKDTRKNTLSATSDFAPIKDEGAAKMLAFALASQDFDG